MPLADTFVEGSPGAFAFLGQLADQFNVWEGVTPAQFLQFTNTDAGTTPRVFVGGTAPTSPNNGDLWFDLARVESKFETGSWPAVTEVAVTATANTYTRTTAQPAALYTGDAYASVGRISTTGATGNDRRFLTFDAMPAVDDSTITSLWAQHSHTGGQFGHVHRLQNIGSASQVGVVVWQDDLFGSDDVINFAVWTGNTSGTFAHSVEAQSSQAQGLLNDRTWDAATYAVNGSNVATIVTKTPNQIEVGQYLEFGNWGGTGAPAGTAPVLSVVDAFTFTIAWTHATITTTTAPAGSVVRSRTTNPAGTQTEGFGTRSLVPQWVSSRLEGDVISSKVWRVDQPEPSWADPNFVQSRTMVNAGRPVGTGKNGILFGHVTSAGPIDYAAIRITRAVPGIKARVAGAWQSLSSFTR